MKLKIPITHRAYMITGFVLSGYLFFFPGMVKLPNENVKELKCIKIPDGQLRYIYTGLEIKRRIYKLYRDIKNALHINR